MADPVIPGGIRVQFVMPGRTGLPEDRYITTWAFRTEDNLPPTDAQLTTAVGLVTEFYVGVTAPATSAIRVLLAAAINQPQCEGRAYRLGDSVPRAPFIVPVNLGAISSGNSLPSEVALCASFYSVRNLPRRRGRVFIGPLTDTAKAAPAATTGLVQPVPAAIDALRTSMVRLRSAAVTAGLRWCVLSQANAEMVDVTAGWVDNAFDTQRRRGEDATTRSTWNSVV
jgi:hypothetical protein